MSTALTPPARLGLHHFAHLRAVAEGLSVAEAGQRYLGAERGGDARAAHRALVERVAAIARRRGDPRWRLLGIEIHEVAGGDAGLAPPLHAWAEAQGLEDWPEAELQALHAERFGAIDPGVLRRQVRNARLCAQ